MSVTPSTMLALGTSAPDFNLPDTDGTMVTLADFAHSRALLVIFLCNHCPYVKLLRTELAALADEYQARGVAIVGINSNDASRFAADSPEKMKEEVHSAGYTFPYLFDESQEVALAYQAACTPDFFLFDRDRKLVYRGQFDDSRPQNGVTVSGRDLRAAMDLLLQGKPIPAQQKPSTGCNIKWKPGKEPAYFKS